MRLIGLTKTGLKTFPIFNTNRARLLNFIDINNICGNGCNGVYSVTGVDKSQIIYISPDVESLLLYHYQQLKNNAYFIDK